MLRLGRAVLGGLGLCVVMGMANPGQAEETTEPFELVPIFAADEITPTTAPATSPTTAPAAVPSPIIAEVASPPPRHYRRVIVEEAPADTEFARNHFELTLFGQGYTAYRHGGSDTIVMSSFDVSYYVADGISIGLEAGWAPGTFRNHHHHHGDDDEASRAEDVLGIVRWHFLTIGAFSLYGDAGLGALHSDHHFPAGGREDNAIGVAGLGATWKLADHWYLCGGARYARLESGEWNDHHNHHDHHQGADGVQYYGGFTFIF